MLTFRHLEVFTAVAATGNVTAAAARLHTTQPNVSRILAQVEAAVGFPVMVRTNRGVTLTPEGQTLLKEVQQALRGLSSVEEVARQIRELKTTRLSIASVSGPLISVVPRVVRKWRDMHGDLAYLAEIHEPLTIVHMIRDGLVDIGLTSPVENLAGTKVLKRWSNDYLAIGKPGCTVLDRPKPLNLTEFSGPLIVPGAKYLAARCVDPAVGEALLHRTHIDSFLSFACLPLVKEGLGIAIVDPVVAAHVVEREGLLARRIIGGPVIELAIIIPAHRPMSLVAREFSSLLIQEIDHLLDRNERSSAQERL